MNVDLHADLGLEGKVAIVAGGGAAGDGIGNGRAAAILLARAGARVLIVDRSLDLAEGTVRMIASEGGEAAPHEADLTDEGQCKAMAEAALARFGRIDVLDNNAGIGSLDTVVAETQNRWERVMRVNVEAMFLTSKHVIPAMIESGDAWHRACREHIARRVCYAKYSVRSSARLPERRTGTRQPEDALSASHTRV